MLHKLPFYDELRIEKILDVCKRCAKSYRIETIDSKDPLNRLEASKSSIKDLSKDFLSEIKGFKYQITLKVLLRKRKENEDIEFTPVCFNSTFETIILNMILINLSKTFCTESIIGLMNNLVK